MDALVFLAGLYYSLRGRREDWVLLCYSILSTNFLGYGVFFEKFNILSQSLDFGLLLLFVMIVINIRRRILYEDYFKVRSYIRFFFLFVLLEIIVDILFNYVAFSDIIKTTRYWLFLLIFIPVSRIEENKISKFLHVLLSITLVMCVINVFEYVLGIHFFTEVPKEVASGEIRGPLPPVYTMLFALAVFAGYPKLAKKRKIVYLIILFAGLMVSETRSIFLAFFTGVAIIMFFRTKKRMLFVGKLVAASLLIGAMLFMLPNMKKRFLESGEELEQGISKDMTVEGNTTLRMAMLIERIDYLQQETHTFLFGIGNVTEKNFRQIFMIGNPAEDGGVMQLQTGDISWMLLFLRLGLMGVIVYSIMYFGWLSVLFKKKHEPLSIALVSYMLITFFILSWAGMGLYSAFFADMPIIGTLTIKNKRVKA